MPKLLLLPVLLFTFFIRIHAQQIDVALGEYAEKFSPEKLHLHFDRSIYNKGEVVYYKAYLLSDHGLSDISKNLYVDLYDEAGKLLQQATAPLIQSSAAGSFSIPVKYWGRSVQVKAYTKWMLNFDTSFIYNRLIRIYQPVDSAIVTKENKQPIRDSTIISLFPEGGFSIEGLNNRFAFTAIDLAGDPVFIKGVVKGSDGKMTDSISSVHDGMGSFSLYFQKGLSYSFEWKDEKGKAGVTKITPGKNQGAVLRVIPQSKKAVVTIQRSADAGSVFNTMHLLVHRNYDLRYKLDINMSAKTFISLDISTSDFPSGIVQFTLFNDQWLPVAERIIFINNNEYRFQPELTIAKKDLGKKGKNEIEISVRDTLFSNLSLAVVDAATMNGMEEPSIFSDFLISDELKGKLHYPAYYFSQQPNNDSLHAAHLDLVMLTHGHRRYDWEKIAMGMLPAIKYPADKEYLQVKATLTNKKMLRSADKLLLNLMLQGKDSTKTVFIIPGNGDGIFEKKNVFYYDTVKLYYNLNDKRRIAGQNFFEFENGLLTKNEKDKYFANQLLLKNKINYQPRPNDAIGQIQQYFLFDEQQKIINETIFQELKEVVVSSKVKTKIQILDNYYTRGVFAGDGNNYKVDIQGDINARGFNSIFYYLQSKIPGLGVFGTGPDVTVTWLKSFSLYGAEKSEPVFFLDEVMVGIDAINTVSIADIAYVKAFRPPFVGAFFNGVNGAIAIYTKKGHNPVYEDTASINLARTVLVGYTAFKEFTQPDYENGKEGTPADYRSTLYWNPYILTDRSNQRIGFSFYNNDISKKLFIILEGVNLAGKMTRVVKLIE